MDDYYSLLGIDADASVDDIKGAYRVRKDGLDTASDSGKADAAKLNKAWNVLSDPYQRGRYDEKRALAADDGTLGTEDDAAASPNGARTPSKNARATSSRNSSGQERAQAAREARAARMKPTITPPAGTKFPAQRQRIIAMVIDLLILFLLFFASQLIIVSQQKSQHPAAYKAKQELIDHTIPDAQKQTSDDNKALSAAKKANPTADTKTLDAKIKADKDKETALNKQLDTLTSTMSGIAQTFTIGFFLIGFAYLVIPSALTGRTLGKRVMHLRAVREDGRKLGFAAVVRYGLVVIVTYMLALVVGPIAPVVVLFGVTMWMRHANMQGLHDRFAHTIVVSDAAD